MPTIALINEKELVQQVADGSEAAYRKLFAHYWDSIYSVAFVFTKSREMAQDLTQDVFARIWIKREMLKDIGRFDAYLFIMARNVIVDRLRKKVFTTGNEANLIEFFADSALTPYDRAELKEMEEIIHRGVAVLPERQRMAFRLSRFQGLGHDEIALRMGVSKESVKSYIVRALSQLRKYLAHHSEVMPLICCIAFFLQ